MCRPKDQTRRPARAEMPPMDDNFDPIAHKASNAILPSEKPAGASAAPEPKAATPAPKKPKAQPAAKPKPQKQELTWQPPEGAVTIFEKPEYTKPIGYIELKGQVYEAYTITGQRLTIGLNEQKTEENYRQKYAAHKAR